MRLRLVMAVTLLLSGLLSLAPAQAGCAGAGARGTNPSMSAIDAEIDRAAGRRQVPPYVLKSIAWHESRWRQFYSDGRVVVSGSCALGVMQVLASGGFDAYRLATDYRYNIDAGAQVIAAKMSASSANVPAALGADDRRVAENWYRAVYRYIGAGWYATQYADKVFATIVTPPAELRPWVHPVPVANPRYVVSGYSPQGGHAYVARADGTWVSTLGTYRHRVNRADWLAGAARARAGTSLEGDQRTTTSFVARNLGWQTWSADRVTLSTSPMGRASRLRHPAWRTSTRPVGVAAPTPPGTVGRFTFPVMAANPASSVTVTETFAPVVDGSLTMVAKASSTWTLHPARLPVARISSAPEYVTDRSTDSSATISLTSSDPSPGSGVAYLQVSRLQPGSTTWSAPAKVYTSAPRLNFTAAGAHSIRVRAVDRASHVGAWSAPARVVVPRDNTHVSLAFAGDWAAPPVEGSWLGSMAVAASGSVSMPVNGASYALIGSRGPGLAPLTVYVDDVLVTVVRPDAATTTHRHVLWEGPLTPGDHVLRVVVGDDTQLTPHDPGDTAFLDAIAVA